MPKKMTASDIARLAGVSRSTVSRALNPDTCWRISREKCEEIRALCRKYGVMPSRAARPDRLKPTRRIALVLGAMERDLGKPESGAMIRRMCDILQGSGCTLELIRADHRPGRLAPHIRRILDSNTADVYIAGGMVRSPSFSVVGSFTSEFFKDFHADIAFFSCTSYRAAYGCFESSKAEVPPKKTIVSNADKSVLLVDSSKLEAPAAFASVGNSEIVWMITDKGISEEEREAVTKKNVRLLVVD
ncbi:MAG: DeoR/GlpR transcriptional regulator [Clostridia bacterium]|nr:DeoR/GlpR transcriptional regulator [Clostridia bacterium]